MSRLKIVVEGPTEREFVNNVLAPYLHDQEVYTQPIVVSASRARRSQDQLGGGGSFGKTLRTIRDTLRNDRSAYCTTMVDYYSLPADYPGLDADDCPPSSQLYDRIDCLERRLAEAIGDTHRFVPYLQAHEFEALLFSDVEVIDRALRMHGPVGSRLDDLQSIVDHFDNPEWIDDGAETAPSKRLKGLFPRYDKVLHGEMIAYDIGLHRIREACPHFDSWVTRLGSLAPLNA